MVRTREELVAYKRLVGRIIGFYLRVFLVIFAGVGSVVREEVAVSIVGGI